ncbi:conserved hypothetical protein [Ricinus communis]|uniref:Uncharacterized protein n=1 Tax=Ricinus communis TaxID=3988 RepID=B9TM23_RICCO|nr:conserved hypothetical protein [Ricinus communis]
MRAGRRRAAGRQRLDRMPQQRRPHECDRAHEPHPRTVLRRTEDARRTDASRHAPVDEPALSQLCGECALVGRQGARVRRPAGGEPVLAEPPVRHREARQAGSDRAVFRRRREGVVAADGPARPVAQRRAGQRRLRGTAPADPVARAEIPGQGLARRRHARAGETRDRMARQCRPSGGRCRCAGSGGGSGDEDPVQGRSPQDGDGERRKEGLTTRPQPGRTRIA